MQVEQQVRTVIGVELAQRVRHILGVAVGRFAVGYMQDRRRVGIWVRVAPLRHQPGRPGQRRPHRRAALVARLEPDREFGFLLDDAAGAVIDRTHPLLDPQRGLSHRSDRVHDARRQGTAEAARHARAAVAEHADFEIIADSVGLRAVGDQGVEGLVQDVGDEFRLHAAALGPLVHGARLPKADLRRDIKHRGEASPGPDERAHRVPFPGR